MCCMLCICKKCCCGVELANGVAIFAYFDIILHLIFLPVPGRLYEIYPLAKYAIAWIFIRCKLMPLKTSYPWFYVGSRATHHFGLMFSAFSDCGSCLGPWHQDHSTGLSYYVVDSGGNINCSHGCHRKSRHR